MQIARRGYAERHGRKRKSKVREHNYWGELHKYERKAAYNKPGMQTELHGRDTRFYLTDKVARSTAGRKRRRNCGAKPGWRQIKGNKPQLVKFVEHNNR